MLNNLIGNLNRPFDTDLKAAVALRVRHADGLKWEVSGRRLKLTTDPGTVIADIDLTEIAVSELADMVTSAGVIVSYENPDYGSRSADCLVDGSGHHLSSNGDAISCFNSLLISLLDAYAKELETCSVDIGNALDQAYMDSADELYLDYWGGMFGIDRLTPGSDDASYLDYIIAEVTRLRVNSISISRAVFEATGINVFLHEPWRTVMLLDGGRLSDGFYIHEGNFHTWNVFQPQSEDACTASEKAEILRIINRSRPVGSLIVLPFNALPVFHVDGFMDPDATVTVAVVRPSKTSSTAVRINTGTVTALAVYATKWSAQKIWNDRPWAQLS